MRLPPVILYKKSYRYKNFNSFFYNTFMKDVKGIRDFFMKKIIFYGKEGMSPYNSVIMDI